MSEWEWWVFIDACISVAYICLPWMLINKALESFGFNVDWLNKGPVALLIFTVYVPYMWYLSMQTSLWLGSPATAWLYEVVDVAINWVKHFLTSSS